MAQFYAGAGRRIEEIDALLSHGCVAALYVLEQVTPGSCNVLGSGRDAGTEADESCQSGGGSAWQRIQHVSPAKPRRQLPCSEFFEDLSFQLAPTECNKSGDFSFAVDHTNKMPPRPSFVSAFRALSVRPRPPPQWLQNPCMATPAQRNLTIDSNASQQPPSQEISDTLREKMKAYGHSMETAETGGPAGGVPAEEVLSENELALRQLELAVYGVQPWDPNVQGHKFGVPDSAVAKDRNHKSRYHPVVEQMTKLLMRDGKLAKAQRVGRVAVLGGVLLMMRGANFCRRTWP